MNSYFFNFLVKYFATHYFDNCMNLVQIPGFVLYSFNLSPFFMQVKWMITFLPFSDEETKIVKVNELAQSHLTN